MPASVQFAIGVPNIADYADASLLGELAQEAETAGWDGFFLWDHLIYRNPNLPLVDPWIAMAVVAERTSRVRIGVLMAGVPRRRPWKLAREAVTLDQLSGGRLVFGAALGSMPEEYERFGEDPDLRVRAGRLDEGLEVIAGLWSAEPFSFAGEHFRVDDVQMRPPPVHSPRIPVWLGGQWPNRKPFRRAARWDGVMPTHVDYGHGETMPPEEFSACVEFVHRQGVTDPFDFALEGETSEPGPQGWQVVEPYAAAGLTWWVEKLGWWRGPMDEMRARIRAGPPTTTR